MSSFFIYIIYIIVCIYIMNKLNNLLNLLNLFNLVYKDFARLCVKFLGINCDARNIALYF
jgi:hypothetical protein